MFNPMTPEKAGVSSTYVKKFLETVEKRGLVTHGVIMMKGNGVFAEYYWKPFDKDKCHRMYSETKSFVSVAIGLLEEDGLISLDDPVCRYFPEKVDRVLPQYLRKQTIRQMLTMETCGKTPSWFRHTDPDRTHLYFAENEASVPSGMRWRYDSAGSQVLGSLVEKLSGRSLFDFLYDRIFVHLGTFKTARILKTKTDDSFCDSALICTHRDIASFARFLLNGGKWNGKRLLNKEYIKNATSRAVDNNVTGFDGVLSKGYGYQFWRTGSNGFALCGMGCQLTVCLPDKDLIFVCTGDDQGYPEAEALMLTAFYDIVADNVSDAPLPENESAFRDLQTYGNALELYHLKGDVSSGFEKILSGKEYVCKDNPTGITRFSFEFDGEGAGRLRYTNAQGEKILPFGLGKNVFGKFPEYGYPDGHAGVPSEDPDFTYDCAASACWAEREKLLLKVQIIDKYLGNFFAVFSFREDIATVTVTKNAEDFLDNYSGEFTAELKSRT